MIRLREYFRRRTPRTVLIVLLIIGVAVADVSPIFRALVIGIPAAIYLNRFMLRNGLTLRTLIPGRSRDY